MADKSKDAFVAYYEWADAIKDLPDEQQAKFFRAMFNYARTGDTGESMNAMELVAWGLIKNGIDRQQAKYSRICEKRREAGMKHKGNQYTRMLEQNGTNGTNASTVEQNGTNGTIENKSELEYQLESQLEYQSSIKENINTPIPPFEGALKKGDFSSFRKVLEPEAIDWYRRHNDDGEPNLGGLLRACKTYGIDDWIEVAAIVRSSDYGRLSHPIWATITKLDTSNWRPDNMFAYLIKVAKNGKF